MIQEQINTECRTAAIGCIDCKKLVADRVVEQMTPMWDSRTRLSKDTAHLNDIVAEGSRRASEVAKATLHDVNDAMNI
jgi:tryptophanyl-tRNA synthetase